jgi:hypothetical protein
MSRNTGTFNFAANFEGLLKAPLDAKQLVGTKADLISPATWNGSGSVWLYNGAIVSVGSDPITSNNGIYWLCDSLNYTSQCNWIKAGADGGVTGATNGIGMTNQKVYLNGVLTGNTNFNGGILGYSSHPAFSQNTQIVDKQYVDTIASGLRPKQAVSVATIVGQNINLGAGGFLVIDGVTTTNGMRVLVKNQTNATENGIYSANTGTWVRTADFDGTPSGEVISGSYMWVLSGNTNANEAWVLDTPDPIVIGVSDLNFVLFGNVQNIIGGTGINVSANTGTYIINFNGSGTTGNGLFWNSGISKIELSSSNQQIINAAITGASNGLHKSGVNVVLGGTLTGNTTIGGGSHSLSLGASGSILNVFNISGTTANISTTGNIGICANSTLSLYGSTISVNNLANYNANYCGVYGSRSLVDKEYVDNKVAASSNVLSVVNSSGTTYIATTLDSFIGVSGGTYVILPNPPKSGQRIIVSDICGNALYSQICIDGQGIRINDSSCTFATINTNYGSLTFVYNANSFWSGIGFVN